MKVIVITSGGMDSTAALYWAMNRELVTEVKTLSFNYAQRHVKELQSASLISAHLGIEHEIVDLTSITKLLKGSALTDAIDVPHGHYEEDNMKVTVVPNRNAIMANIGAAWAVSEGASGLVMGMHSGDHAIYPDCRPEFIDAQERTLRVANEGFITEQFDIFVPWILVSKAEIIRYCEENNYEVPWELTWTCYEGGEKHCGRCATCVERLEAFSIENLVDPVAYEDRNYWKRVIDEQGNV